MKWAESKLWQWVVDRFLPLKPYAGRWWETEIRHGDRSGKAWWYLPATLFGPLQPVNSYSNVAYALFGIATALAFGTAEALVFALVMTFLAAGSFLYHALPSRKTAALDHAGMYAVFITLTTYVVGGGVPLLWALMALWAGIGAYLLRYAFSAPLNVMMGVFLYIASLAVWGSGSTLLLVSSLIAFALGMVFWLMDRERVLTGRWGHGFWHVCTAAALALMFAAAS